MRRRLLALCGLMVGLALPVVVPSPALAYQTDTTCKTVFQDDTVKDQMCIGARTHGLNGGGWALDEVDISITGGGWESLAVNCDWLRAFNDVGVARWSRDGNACDLAASTQYRTFYPDVNFPNTTQVTVQWAGYPKLDGAPDPGYTKVRVVLP